MMDSLEEGEWHDAMTKRASFEGDANSGNSSFTRGKRPSSASAVESTSPTHGTRLKRNSDMPETPDSSFNGARRPSSTETRSEDSFGVNSNADGLQQASFAQRRRGSRNMSVPGQKAPSGAKRFSVVNFTRKNPTRRRSSVQDAPYEMSEAEREREEELARERDAVRAEMLASALANREEWESRTYCFLVAGNARMPGVRGSFLKAALGFQKELQQARQDGVPLSRPARLSINADKAIAAASETAKAAEVAAAAEYIQTQKGRRKGERNRRRSERDGVTEALTHLEAQPDAASQDGIAAESRDKEAPVSATARPASLRWASLRGLGRWIGVGRRTKYRVAQVGIPDS